MTAGRGTGAEGTATGSVPGDSELAALAARSAAQMRSENFPVALRLLPAQPRDALARTYAYARFVDDVGDEARGDRVALLAAVAADVRKLPAGTARLGPVVGMRHLLDRYGLSVEPLLDLVEANRRDQGTVRYRDFAELAEYCRYSANPVGRIVLRIADADTAEAVRRSDAICTALQVLEHCQDVGEDARRGRVYLTADELAAAGVPDDDLRATKTSPRLRDVVARHVARAEGLLDEGRDLPRLLHGWARVAVAGYLAGGRATAHALRRHEYDVLAEPIRPGRLRTASHVVRVLTGTVRS